MSYDDYESYVYDDGSDQQDGDTYQEPPPDDAPAQDDQPVYDQPDDQGDAFYQTYHGADQGDQGDQGDYGQDQPTADVTPEDDWYAKLWGAPPPTADADRTSAVSSPKQVDWYDKMWSGDSASDGSVARAPDDTAAKEPLTEAAQAVLGAQAAPQTGLPTTWADGTAMTEKERKQAQIYHDSLMNGLDAEGARIMVAVSQTEGGLTGMVGDTNLNPGGSRGPFQFYEGGEMPAFRAWLRDNNIQGDPNVLVNDVGIATKFAATDYLGNAIKRGQAQGLHGAELATYAQRTGQRSVDPERTGQNYYNLFGSGDQFGQALAHAQPDPASRAVAAAAIPPGHWDGDGHDHGVATPYTQQQADGAGNVYTIAFDFGAKYDQPFNPNIPIHRGVDLTVTGAPNNGEGLPYEAFRSGRVAAITNDPNGGIGIIVDTGDPHARYDRYFHNNAVAVREGDTVVAGQTQLGIIGETGTKGFPHLHYEVSQGIDGDPVDRLIDPRPYISKTPPPQAAPAATQAQAQPAQREMSDYERLNALRLKSEGQPTVTQGVQVEPLAQSAAQAAPQPTDEQRQQAQQKREAYLASLPSETRGHLLTWQALRSQRGEDPNDQQAFEAHLAAIHAQNPWAEARAAQQAPRVAAPVPSGGEPPARANIPTQAPAAEQVYTVNGQRVSEAQFEQARQTNNNLQRIYDADNARVAAAQAEVAQVRDWERRQSAFASDTSDRVPDPGPRPGTPNLDYLQSRDLADESGPHEQAAPQKAALASWIETRDAAIEDRAMHRQNQQGERAAADTAARNDYDHRLDIGEISNAVNPEAPGSLRPGDLPPDAQGNRPWLTPSQRPAGGIQAPPELIDSLVPRPAQTGPEAASAENPPQPGRFDEGGAQPGRQHIPTPIEQQRADAFADDTGNTPMPSRTESAIAALGQSRFLNEPATRQAAEIQSTLASETFGGGLYQRAFEALEPDTGLTRHIAGTDPVGPLRELGANLLGADYLPPKEELNPEGRPANAVLGGLLTTALFPHEIAGPLFTAIDPQTAAGFWAAGGVMRALPGANRYLLGRFTSFIEGQQELDGFRVIENGRERPATRADLRAAYDRGVSGRGAVPTMDLSRPVDTVAAAEAEARNTVDTLRGLVDSGQISAADGMRIAGAATRSYLDIAAREAVRTAGNPALSEVERSTALQQSLEARRRIIGWDARLREMGEPGLHAPREGVPEPIDVGGGGPDAAPRAGAPAPALGPGPIGAAAAPQGEQFVAAVDRAANEVRQEATAPRAMGAAPTRTALPAPFTIQANEQTRMVAVAPDWSSYVVHETTRDGRGTRAFVVNVDPEGRPSMGGSVTGAQAAMTTPVAEIRTHDDRVRAIRNTGAVLGFLHDNGVVSSRDVSRAGSDFIQAADRAISQAQAPTEVRPSRPLPTNTGPVVGQGVQAKWAPSFADEWVDHGPIAGTDLTFRTDRAVPAPLAQQMRTDPGTRIIAPLMAQVVDRIDQRMGEAGVVRQEQGPREFSVAHLGGGANAWNSNHGWNVGPPGPVAGGRGGITVDVGGAMLDAISYATKRGIDWRTDPRFAQIAAMHVVNTPAHEVGHDLEWGHDLNVDRVAPGRPALGIARERPGVHGAATATLGASVAAEFEALVPIMRTLQINGTIGRTAALAAQAMAESSPNPNWRQYGADWIAAHGPNGNGQGIRADRPVPGSVSEGAGRGVGRAPESVPGRGVLTGSGSRRVAATVGGGQPGRPDAGAVAGVPDIGPPAEPGAAPEHPAIAAARARSEQWGVARVRSDAADYVRRAGVRSAIPLTAYVGNDVATQRRIAQVYDSAVSNPSDPRTREAYGQMAREVDAQYRHLVDKGVRFIPYYDGRPAGDGSDFHGYPDSPSMVRDIAENNRLYVYADALEHPLLGGGPAPQDNANWRFRAVHDYFGHAAHGYEFGPRGEESAWLEHVKMFSPLAARAMTTETRGQNSWVNFGPQAEGVPLKDRPFADQKVFLLPGWALSRAEAYPGEHASMIVGAAEANTAADGSHVTTMAGTRQQAEYAAALLGREQGLPEVVVAHLTPDGSTATGIVSITDEQDAYGLASLLGNLGWQATVRRATDGGPHELHVIARDTLPEEAAAKLSTLAELTGSNTPPILAMADAVTFRPEDYDAVIARGAGQDTSGAGAAARPERVGTGAQGDRAGAQDAAAVGPQPDRRTEAAPAPIVPDMGPPPIIRSDTRTPTEISRRFEDPFAPQAPTEAVRPRSGTAAFVDGQATLIENSSPPPITNEEAIAQGWRGLPTGPVRSGQDLYIRLLVTPFISQEELVGILGDRPEDIDQVVRFMGEQRQKVREGRLLPSDVAKAYIMTVASQGNGAIDPAIIQSKTGVAIPEHFLRALPDGRWTVRPEDATAAWLASPVGQTALADMDEGRYNVPAWQQAASIRGAFSDDRVNNLNVLGLRPGTKLTMRNIAEITREINANGENPEGLSAILERMSGVSTRKAPFMAHLFGFGETPTIDAREINVWLTGRGDIRGVNDHFAETARALNQHLGTGLRAGRSGPLISGLLLRRITDSYNTLRSAGFAPDIPQSAYAAIMHDWLFAKIQGMPSIKSPIFDVMAAGVERPDWLPDGAPNRVGAYRIVDGQLTYMRGGVSYTMPPIQGMAGTHGELRAAEPVTQAEIDDATFARSWERDQADWEQGQRDLEGMVSDPEHENGILRSLGLANGPVPPLERRALLRRAQEMPPEAYAAKREQYGLQRAVDDIKRGWDPEEAVRNLVGMDYPQDEAEHYVDRAANGIPAPEQPLVKGPSPMPSEPPAAPQAAAGYRAQDGRLTYQGAQDDGYAVRDGRVVYRGPSAQAPEAPDGGDEWISPAAREVASRRTPPPEGFAQPGELTRLTEAELPNREIFERAGWRIIDGGYMPPGTDNEAGEAARMPIWRQIEVNPRIPPGLRNPKMERFLDALDALRRGMLDGTTAPEISVLGSLLAIGSVKRAGRSYGKTLKAIEATRGGAEELALRTQPDIYPQRPPSPQEKGILVRPAIIWAMLAGDTTDPVMMGMLAGIARPDAFATPEARQEAIDRGVDELYRRLGGGPETAIHGRNLDPQMIAGRPITRSGKELDIGSRVGWAETEPGRIAEMRLIAQAMDGTSDESNPYHGLDSEALRLRAVENLIAKSPSGVGPVKTRFTASMTALPEYATLDTRMLRDVYGLSPKAADTLTVREYEYLSDKLREIGSDTKYLYGHQWLPWEFLTDETTTYNSLIGVYQRVNAYMARAEALARHRGVPLGEVLDDLSASEDRLQVTLRDPEVTTSLFGLAFRPLDARPEDAEGHEAVIRSLAPGRASKKAMQEAFPELFNLIDDAGLKTVGKLGVALGGWFDSDEGRYYIDRSFDLSVEGPRSGVEWLAAGMMMALPNEKAVMLAHTGAGANMVDHIGTIEAKGMTEGQLTAFGTALSDAFPGWSLLARPAKGGVYDVQIVSAAVTAFEDRPGGALEELDRGMQAVVQHLQENGVAASVLPVQAAEVQFIERGEGDANIRAIVMGGPRGARILEGQAAADTAGTAGADAGAAGGASEAGDGIQGAGGLPAAAFRDQDRGDQPAQGPSAQVSEPPHEFASTQLDMPEHIAARARALGERIPDEHLSKPPEDDPHVTVKYGLHADDPTDVQALASGHGPITVRFGKTSIFPASEARQGADVVKVDVESPELRALNAKLSTLPNGDTHEYKPHMTVAYVKTGLGERYAGLDDLEGQTATLDRLTFSGKDRTKATIPLAPQPSAREIPPELRQVGPGVAGPLGGPTDHLPPRLQDAADKATALQDAMVRALRDEHGMADEDNRTLGEHARLYTTAVLGLATNDAERLDTVGLDHDEAVATRDRALDLLGPQGDAQVLHDAERAFATEARRPVGPSAMASYYHGTPGAFDQVDPVKFDNNGLFGPGYYLTSDPRVASSYATGGIGKSSSAMQSIPEIERNIATLEAGLADPEKSARWRATQGQSGRGNFYEHNLDLLDRLRERLDEAHAKVAGANVRKVDVPDEFRMFDADAPVDPDEAARIFDSVERTFSDATERAGKRRISTPLQEWDLESGDTFWNRLTMDKPSAMSHGDARAVVNQALADAGYDGITHRGGKLNPMQDEHGNPIEHDVAIVFPSSVAKVRNQFDARPEYGPSPMTVDPRDPMSVGDPLAGMPEPVDPYEDTDPEWLAMVEQMHDEAALAEIREPGGFPDTDSPAQAAEIALADEPLGPPIPEEPPVLGPPIPEANPANFPEWARSGIGIAEGMPPEQIRAANADIGDVLATIAAGPNADLPAADQHALAALIVQLHNRVKALAAAGGADGGGLSPAQAARLQAATRQFTAVHAMATVPRSGWEGLGAIYNQGAETGWQRTDEERVRLAARAMTRGRPGTRRGPTPEATVQQTGAAMAAAINDPGNTPARTARIVAEPDLSVSSLEWIEGMRYNSMLMGTRGVLIDYITNGAMLLGKVGEDFLLPEQGGLDPRARIAITRVELAAARHANRLVLTNIGNAIWHGVLDSENEAAGQPHALSNRFGARIEDRTAALEQQGAGAGRLALDPRLNLMRGQKLMTIAFTEIAPRFKASADLAIKTWAFAMEQARQAAVMATQEGEHAPDSEAWHRRIAEIMDGQIVRNPSSQADRNRNAMMIADMQARSRRAAERVTFQGEMGTAGRMLEAARQAPGGKLAVPFLRTLYHIAHWSIDLSPVGAATTLADVMRVPAGRALQRFAPRVANTAIPFANTTIGAAASGPYRDAWRGTQVGRGVSDLDRRILANLFGTLAFGALLQMAAGGILSGTGPPDSPIPGLDDEPPDRVARERANAMRAAGWRPYSVKIAGQWIPYRNWGPLAFLMAGAAAIVETHRYGLDPSQQSGTGLGSVFRDLLTQGDSRTARMAARRFAGIATDMSFLSSVTDLIGLAQSGYELMAGVQSKLPREPGETLANYQNRLASDKIRLTRQKQADVHNYASRLGTSFVGQLPSTLAQSQDATMRDGEYGSYRDDLARIIPDLGPPLPAGAAPSWGGLPSLAASDRGSATGRRSGLPIRHDALGRPVPNEYQGLAALNPFAGVREDLSSESANLVNEAGLGLPSAPHEIIYSPTAGAANVKGKATGAQGRTEPILLLLTPAMREDLQVRMGEAIDQRIQQVAAEVPPEQRAADPDAWRQRLAQEIADTSRATIKDISKDEAHRSLFFDPLSQDPDRTRPFVAKPDPSKAPAEATDTSADGVLDLAPPDATPGPSPATGPTQTKADLQATQRAAGEPTATPVPRTPAPGSTPRPSPTAPKPVAPIATPRPAAPAPTAVPPVGTRTQAQTDRERALEQLRKTPVPSR